MASAEKAAGVPGSDCVVVRQNLANLDHLRFDVGFDYRMKGRALSILKSGYFGVFRPCRSARRAPAIPVRKF
jgi:hypothetical protein